MLDNIKADLSAFTCNGDLVSKLKCVLISHAFHMVAIYRVGTAFSAIPFIGVPIRVFFEYFIRIIYASDISLKSKIGPGLMIVHGHDIVIGGEVVIGKGCKILNGVTIGNKDTESLFNQQPIIGDDVVIGSGAKLLGAIHIGNRVIIGANSVVLKNFASDNVLAGVPAKIIKTHSLVSRGDNDAI